MKQEHEIMYDILVEFDRICKKHNLKYSLIDGTLLGAIRHQGFIPWDDDIDVGMLREDYDRLDAIIASELSEGYVYQTHETQPESVQAFAKIRSDRLLLIQDIVKDRNMHHGVWLDIFPFEYVPEDKSLQDKQVEDIRSYNKKLKLLNYVIFNEDDSIIKKIAKSPFVFYTKLFGKNDKLSHRLIVKRDALIQQYNDRPSSLVANLSEGASPSYGRFVFERKIFDEFEELQFEKDKFSCFKDYEAFLTTTYGDYLTPPPSDQQVGTHT